MLLAALALAQAPPPLPPGFYRVGGGVSAPQVIEKTAPEYSEEARRALLQGTALVRIVVDAKGLPRDIKVLKTLGLGLDEKAIEAVSQWRFAPGMRYGQAVAVMAKVEVNFRLLDEAQAHGAFWALTRASFQTPEGASRPTIDRTTYPKESGHERWRSHYHSRRV